MDTSEIISHAEKLIEAANAIGERDRHILVGVRARACDFLLQFAGPKSSFYKQAQSAPGSTQYSSSSLAAILEAFVEHLESGLVGGISPKRQAELDVVSDLLDQAHNLLESNKVHAAAPAVLIGATLEEFLRTWVESEELSMGTKKPSLDSYTKVLREADLITKQDVKDLTSWAGIRNNAAHGQWDELGDKQRIKLMLDGVNLFMRSYSK